MGKGSRRDVKRLISGGEVSVNGEIIRDAAFYVDTDRDSVCLAGEEVPFVRYIYLMMNKPEGYICSVRDKKFKVVTDLVPQKYSHYNVFPIGRLDLDTTGLLILSNDGKFSHELLSPNKNVSKVYEVVLDVAATDAQLSQLEEGVTILLKNREEHFCRALSAERVDSEAEGCVERRVDNEAVSKEDGSDNPADKIRLTISEGKFHQVKKMLGAVGLGVMSLKRVRIGALDLDGSLLPGEVRELTPEECALAMVQD